MLNKLEVTFLFNVLKCFFIFSCFAFFNVSIFWGGRYVYDVYRFNDKFEKLLSSDAERPLPITSESNMASSAQLLMLLLATLLAYPRSVAGEVSYPGLAGAVVGTFLGTLLLCGVLATLGYCCCYRGRKHQQKQPTPDAKTGKGLSTKY